jgi:hypothetical protein
MPEETKSKAAAPAGETPAKDSPKSDHKMFFKFGAIMVVGFTLMAVVFGFLFLRGDKAEAVPEHPVDMVEVEFANFEIANIVFAFPLTRYNMAEGNITTGNEVQVAVTMVVSYDKSREAQALGALERETPWIKQELRKIIRQEPEPVKVLSEDEQTMKAIREELLLRIRSRIKDDKADILVGKEVIFSSFNVMS